MIIKGWSQLWIRFVTRASFRRLLKSHLSSPSISAYLYTSTNLFWISHNDSPPKTMVMYLEGFSTPLTCVYFVRSGETIIVCQDYQILSMLLQWLKTCVNEWFKPGWNNAQGNHQSTQLQGPPLYLAKKEKPRSAVHNFVLRNLPSGKVFYTVNQCCTHVHI